MKKKEQRERERESVIGDDYKTKELRCPFFPPSPPLFFCVFSSAAAVALLPLPPATLAADLASKYLSFGKTKGCLLTVNSTMLISKCSRICTIHQRHSCLAQQQDPKAQEEQIGWKAIWHLAAASSSP
ncbi:unnamed protein product [Mortierella alpina]